MQLRGLKPLLWKKPWQHAGSSACSSAASWCLQGCWTSSGMVQWAPWPSPLTLFGRSYHTCWLRCVSLTGWGCGWPEQGFLCHFFIPQAWNRSTFFWLLLTILPFLSESRMMLYLTSFLWLFGNWEGLSWEFVPFNCMSLYMPDSLCARQFQVALVQQQMSHTDAYSQMTKCMLAHPPDGPASSYMLYCGHFEVWFAKGCQPSTCSSVIVADGGSPGKAKGAPEPPGCSCAKQRPWCLLWGGLGGKHLLPHLLMETE